MIIAAFKIGDKLQYLGERRTWSVVDGKEEPLIFPGMIVTIVETHSPMKGLGEVTLPDGDVITDYDRDGYNVYKNAHNQGRIIWPKDKKEWKKL